MSAAERASLQGIIQEEILNKNITFYKGSGCSQCADTGYKGRIGIHEVLVIDEGVREAILRKASADEIYRVAITQGMVPMAEDGFLKAANGLTTIEEVLRIHHE